MIEHLEIVEEEAAGLFEGIGIEDAEIEWRNPYLLRKHKHVDNATLNVADENEKENNVCAF